MCGEDLGQPLRTWPRGHMVYGEHDAGEGAPFRAPFFDTGLHCAWYAVMHALLRPGSPHRAASPDEAAANATDAHPADGLLEDYRRHYARRRRTPSS